MHAISIRRDFVKFAGDPALRCRPRQPIALCLACLFLICGMPALLLAAEVARLSPKMWDEHAPHGKEVDCIYGDLVLRNDRLVCVIANPIPGRHANLTVRDVGGCIIDLTRRDPQCDQLSCYYPKLAGQQLALVAAGVIEQGDKTGVLGDKRPAKPDGEELHVSGATVYLQCRAPATEKLPAAEVTYALADGWDYLLVETIYENPSDKTLKVELSDAIRADKTFDRPTAVDSFFYVNDRYFRQGYGILVEHHTIKASGNVLTLHRGFNADEKNSNVAILEPGATYAISRKIFPGDNLFHVLQLARQLRGQDQVEVTIHVTDAGGKPVAGAEVIHPAPPENKSAVPPPPLGQGFTDSRGALRCFLPPGTHNLEIRDVGRETVHLTVDTSNSRNYAVSMLDPGYVVAKITDERGGPIPCKVQFHGLDNTPDPDFGPESAAVAVKNLYYSHNGQFRQPLGPGKYRVIISYGPEYDAVFTEIEVERGKDTQLDAKLVRTVRTPGWISADFHNHSTPSGDNTSSQLGRVLNILCEHVEFAPCTEHNRISSYVPHLKQLGVQHLMATCSGIELTGKPLPLNHQNAFPLIEKPRTQDGGGPPTDEDPELQISRLALWDNNSEKLVQQNHPDIGWLFFDKNGDKIPDGGFAKVLPFMDVMEIHPIEWLLKGPLVEVRGRQENNRVFNWLQLLNQGIRVPGVVNTDSHYNFHESGFWRNYIQSPTDDPAEIQTLDIVRASERGNIIMTTAPFLEVLLVADTAAAPKDNARGMATPDAPQPKRQPKTRGTAGDDVLAVGGKCSLHVRVQCANWYDIDRVQVYLNGRPDPDLNFTRAKDRDKFQGGTVKFEQVIPLELREDTHVLVLAVGENFTLGPVQGPTWGKILPAAINNPIFVDSDGNGFVPNKDTLDAPLPVRSAQ